MKKIVANYEADSQKKFFFSNEFTVENNHKYPSWAQINLFAKKYSFEAVPVKFNLLAISESSDVQNTKTCQGNIWNQSAGYQQASFRSGAPL